LRLRILAIAAWLLAIGYTLVVAPQLQGTEFNQLVESHGTLTVTMTINSEPLAVKGFNNSQRYQVETRIQSPSSISGKQGLLGFVETPKGLRSGSVIRAVVTFSKSHRFGIDFKANLKHLIKLEPRKGANTFNILRASFLTNLRGVSSDAAGLVAGLAIGDDSKVSKKTSDEFKTVSLTHLTAVSGANCAIVLSALALLFGLLPLSRKIRLAFSFLAIAGYLALVGPQPSVLRASWMVGFVLLAQLFGRRLLALDAISLSVIVLLCLEPWLALDYGFALSALATLGLLVLTPPIAERLEGRVPKWLALMIAVTLAAQVMCFPVLLMLQPKLPVYSVLANLLAEPMVLPITVIGLLACLISPLFPWLAGSLCLLASVPASFVIFVAHHLASAPLASLSWFSGLTGIVLGVCVSVCFVILMISRAKRVKGFASISLLLIGGVFFAQNSAVAISSSSFYSGHYTLINCDVGQGDALVLRSEGKVAVVDVGREDPAIDSCLTNLGISHIDLLVLTHFDMDHIGGVTGAITGREVDLALLTSYKDDRPGADFAQLLLSGRGIPMVKAEKGMTGKLGAFDWQVLSPHAGAPEAQDSNDGSVTMLWEDHSIALFTLADLGEKGQLRIGQEQGALLTSGFGGRVVVVKVAHHGSADQSPEFYEAIKPAIALISVGLHNSYGHPTDRTLNFLKYLDSQILRTDLQGAIGVTEAKTGLEVSVAGRS
jgi:competence protein ComEC